VAVVLAYMLEGLVQNLMKTAHIVRNISVIVVFLIFLILSVITLFMLIPLLLDQLTLFVKSSKKFGLFLWKFFDVKVIDGFGPDGISGIIKKFSIKANKFQSGYIYQYAFIMLLGFSAFLTFLIVK